MTSLPITTLVLACSLLCAAQATAATKITFWHSMDGSLGKEVDTLVQRFNQNQGNYKVISVYKGNYEQSLAAGIAAFRTGNAPDILQVYEVGTATMMASKAVRPVYQVFQEAGIEFDESDYIPSVAAYYTDAKTGHMLSQPFNSSTPVLYYNKEIFAKAGLDPDTPPVSWQQLADYSKKLNAAGVECSYSTGWQGWVHLENFSAWNGLPYASKNNGFDGYDAMLEFNNPQIVQHITLLQTMNKAGQFSYFGRKSENVEKFYNGSCAMVINSSGSMADIRHYAKFEFGVAKMPYDANIKSAPQNAIIGGASLWVMEGKQEDTYHGVAAFLSFLMEPENAAAWHQKTGYLPVTNAAYQLSQQQGFYQKNPDADIPIQQMLNKQPLSYTKGLRLGNLPQIRAVVDEELEAVWIGKKTPQQALDSAVQRGNQLLRRFEHSVN